MPKKIICDINMYYEITGKGEPLLFIHGLGSSTRDWEKQVPEFSNNYQVINVDLRGHGRTDRPKGPYSIAMFAEDVAGLLKSLEVGPAHIVGLSMGAAIAFHLAIDHPEVVKTITISNMSAAVPVKTFAEKKMYYMRVLIVKLLGMRMMGRVIASKVFTKPDQQKLRDLLEKRWADNTKKPYLAALRALKNWNVMDRLQKIKCPTLVIHAENDYSPLNHKEEYTVLIPDAKLIKIADAGHIVNMEKAKEYNEILKDFLSEHK